jgi:hypothetical protein
MQGTGLCSRAPRGYTYPMALVDLDTIREDWESSNATESIQGVSVCDALLCTEACRVRLYATGARATQADNSIVWMNAVSESIEPSAEHSFQLVRRRIHVRRRQQLYRPPLRSLQGGRRAACESERIPALSATGMQQLATKADFHTRRPPDYLPIRDPYR